MTHGHRHFIQHTACQRAKRKLALSPLSTHVEVPARNFISSPHTHQNITDGVLWAKYTPSKLLCISDHDIAKKLFLKDKCIFEILIVIDNNNQLSFRRRTLWRVECSKIRVILKFDGPNSSVLQTRHHLRIRCEKYMIGLWMLLMKTSQRLGASWGVEMNSRKWEK